MAPLPLKWPVGVLQGDKKSQADAEPMERERRGAGVEISVQVTHGPSEHITATGVSKGHGRRDRHGQSRHVPVSTVAGVYDAHDTSVNPAESRGQGNANRQRTRQRLGGND